jgi:hypothetical protein
MANDQILIKQLQYFLVGILKVYIIPVSYVIPFVWGQKLVEFS